MFLIDTSVWIDVLRDRTGAVRRSLEAILCHNKAIKFTFSYDNKYPNFNQ
ncbi:hypothetical protein ACE1CI_11005 [Aerosakkonemataceae cyanobacterium BLCC-F50]|uniref:PIN domain-containing protein n=1 Tax=Floridaenema flaviceps BLCC-F50 TaxID=3153642 RepID=A0ABV4XP16_9CYAN